MALDSINLTDWIEQNRDSLKPPVGNKLLYGDGEFQVMIVAGPNTRRDFHCEPGEELFYQLKGDITAQADRGRRASRRDHPRGRHVPAAGQHDPLATPPGRARWAWSSSASGPRTRRSRSPGTARPAGTCCTSSRASSRTSGTQLKPVMEHVLVHPRAPHLQGLWRGHAAAHAGDPLSRSCPSIGSTSTRTSCRRPGRTCGRDSGTAAGPSSSRWVHGGRGSSSTGDRSGRSTTTAGTRSCASSDCDRTGVRLPGALDRAGDVRLLTSRGRCDRGRAAAQRPSRRGRRRAARPVRRPRDGRRSRIRTWPSRSSSGASASSGWPASRSGPTSAIGTSTIPASRPCWRPRIRSVPRSSSTRGTCSRRSG